MVGPFEKGLLTCQRFKRRHNFFSSKTHPHVSVTFIRKSLDLLTPRGLRYCLLTGTRRSAGGDPGALSITPGAYFQRSASSLGRKKVGGGDGTGVRRSSLSLSGRVGRLGSVGRRPLQPRGGRGQAVYHYYPLTAWRLMAPLCCLTAKNTH